MTAPRPIQNFRGFRVVWWGPRGTAAETLTGALFRLGVTLVHLEDIGAEKVTKESDILVVDGDGICDPALFGRPGGILPPVPVIGVVGVEAPSRLKALTDLGATALLRKPIHPGTVYSALFLAANNHARFSRLEARLAEHDRRRSGRRHVIRAVIGLMQDRGMTDEEAYALLRRESMRHRLGVEDYAERVCRDLAGSDPAGSNPKQESDNVENQENAAGDRGARQRGRDEPGHEQGSRPDQTRRA